MLTVAGAFAEWLTDKSAKLSTKRVRNEGDRFLGAKTVFAVLVVVLVVL